MANARRCKRTADGAVLHHVRCSHYAPWVGTTLERVARHAADVLELTTSVRGFDPAMRWRRVRV
ncbi:hypothetical protein RB628_20710 [Streptomyces sp. ADMS]|uniref:hypothetical protein n=1 Tax=Streptomyces sp. ADMS TaxID=3071415 RepID=UPI00296EFD04|nr:hypothetical protein [Streptomyces sp. ADMS]MDW4907704.1 hypothetical protein [Streptomyces sp. ADMS]